MIFFAKVKHYFQFQESFLKLKSILLISLIVSTTVYSRNKVIYGEDNRLDIYEVDDERYIDLAKSTAAMMTHDLLKDSNAQEYFIDAPSFEKRGGCSTERFSEQPTASTCSGFLVGSKLLMTAGHCVYSEEACESNSWVFDYKIDYSGQDKVYVNKDSVYKCKKVIKKSLDHDTLMDYALIELDREVVDRKPLKYRTNGRVSLGAPLLVIGHPTGLPTKIADNATVRSINSIYLRTNLDTYAGNSGSAVFNALTLEVEGILVRGDNDYHFSEERDCNYSNIVAQNGGRGEDVTLITNVKELPNMGISKPERKPWWRRWFSSSR